MGFKRKIKGLMISTIVLLFTGCISFNQPAPVKPVEDTSIGKIQKSAEGIHKELMKLSQIKQEKSKADWEEIEVVKAPTTGPLSKLITFRWFGPIEKAVETIAGMIGYEVKVIGQKPARDKLVNIDAFNQPAFNVLEDLGWQAGEKMGVVVDQELEVLTIAYMGAE